jgi:hypothetical protein
MDTVRVFAGEDNEVAVVPPDVRKLLYKFYKISKQYKTVIEPRTHFIEETSASNSKFNSARLHLLKK